MPPSFNYPLSINPNPSIVSAYDNEHSPSELGGHSIQLPAPVATARTKPDYVFGETPSMAFMRLNGSNAVWDRTVRNGRQCDSMDTAAAAVNHWRASQCALNQSMQQGIFPH